jgi:hypothetical protein
MFVHAPVKHWLELASGKSLQAPQVTLILNARRQDRLNVKAAQHIDETGAKSWTLG